MLGSHILLSFLLNLKYLPPLNSILVALLLPWKIFLIYFIQFFLLLQEGVLVWSNLEDHCQSRTLSQNLLNLISITWYIYILFSLLKSLFLYIYSFKIPFASISPLCVSQSKSLEHWFPIVIIIIEIFSLEIILKVSI